MTSIDRYLLAETTRRLSLALGIVLLALVLERVLRLFEFAADNGAAITLVLQMTASLVPHYLGIALPAAFFISILLLVARLGDDSELDAMMSAGLSVARVTRPLILGGVVLTLLSTALYGYLDPYARYGYRALKHAATHGVWTGTIEQKTFFTPTDGLTIYAGEVDLEGRGMRDVFVRQVTDKGQETVTTASRGELVLDFETGRANVMLQDVVQVVTDPGDAPVTMRLRNFMIDPSFPVEPKPFRNRGTDEREMTLGELWDLRAIQGEVLSTNAADRAAELHGRLVRALSVMMMPFLAIPMGLAAKRQRRGLAIATAAVLLVIYRHMLELGGGLVGSGVVGPVVGFWVPFIGFSAFSVWLFLRVDGPARQNGFDALFDRLERGITRISSLIKRKRRSAPSA